MALPDFGTGGGPGVVLGAAAHGPAWMGGGATLAEFGAGGGHGLVLGAAAHGPVWSGASLAALVGWMEGGVSLV